MLKETVPCFIGVIGLIVKGSGRNKQIMTQIRNVSPPIDTSYNGTWEAVGETLKPGEDYLTALVRGIREECGIDIKISATVVAGQRIWETGKQDKVFSFHPICIVQQLKGRRLWTAPAFEVVVPDDFEPDYQKGDGEAKEAKWWSLKDLKTALELDPASFSGIHLPALKIFCQNELSEVAPRV